ncbi:hypothetical protein B0T22DRAFT_244552 [Podospora appendiculata]|uniref:Bromodomain-containing factor 1 n=1 Tax=Podospora appendiculata TaxID=314037 RepID=A0AAE0X248_9PEZI|nr:hypothetical protein B0T22DRAFT_244552 [Podospora appendiculata]
MAVMSTQQSEGLLLNEKPVPMTSILDKDGRNRSLEINGHLSPELVDSEPKSESAPYPVTPEKTDANTSQNEEAFAANQAQPIASTADEQKLDPLPAPAPAPAELESEPVKEAGQDEMELDAPEPPAATEPTAAPESLEAPVSTTTPASPMAAASGEPVAPQEPPASGEATPAPVPPIEGPQEQVSPDAVPSSASPAIPPPSEPSLLAEEKLDVEMTDAQPQAGKTEADRAETTPETKITDVISATPVDDTTTGVTASLSGIDVGATQPSPVAPETADVSMPDLPQAASKISRERELDSEEEPVAKRAKTETAADEVEVKIGLPQEAASADQPQAAKSELYRDDGEPKSLADDSLNGYPITMWQSKQLRNILAGVKKTKAGANFRLPVHQLWPGLWNDYAAKVPDPTDINTMEKKLRGDLPRYTTMGEFKGDLDRLVQNSILFNGDGHDVTNSARNTKESVLTRMAQVLAAETTRSDKKEAAKSHPTRHPEPRAPAPPAAAPRRLSKGAAASPAPKPVIESPAFAIPAASNGVPLLRRDSNKPDSRAKRPVKPAHSKDLVYETKRKKKLPAELRFCEEVLNEIRKSKHYDINNAFLQPVDPVALNIPSYHKIIKKPMDLQTMANKMSAGEYTNAKEVERDFDLIVKNCRAFNGEEHLVYKQALSLNSLFKKEMSKKEEWLAKHAPATAAASRHNSPQHRSDTEEEPESEPEPEQDEEEKASKAKLASFQKRLAEEQKKINDIITNGTAEEMVDVEIGQTVVAMLQKQIMQERTKLDNMQPKKAQKPSKPVAHKNPKKANHPPVSHSSGASQKKAAIGGSSGGGGVMHGPRKSGKKAAPKKKITTVEREIIAAGIEQLEGQQLEKAIDIIKKDTGQGENDSGELELDIEVLSEVALWKLYDIAVESFPELKRGKERNYPAPAPPAQPANRNKNAASKSKKNKPMSKTEQERRIQQLNELRAQAGRQGSGSQEPMESIEGNGRGSAEPQHRHNQDSEDEESSEEE